MQRDTDNPDGLDGGVENVGRLAHTNFQAVEGAQRVAVRQPNESVCVCVCVYVH